MKLVSEEEQGSAFQSMRSHTNVEVGVLVQGTALLNAPSSADDPVPAYYRDAEVPKQALENARVPLGKSKYLQHYIAMQSIPSRS